MTEESWKQASLYMRTARNESVLAVIPDSPSMSLQLPRYGVGVQDTLPCLRGWWKGGFGGLGSCKRGRIGEIERWLFIQGISKILSGDNIIALQNVERERGEKRVKASLCEEQSKWPILYGYIS